MLVDVKVPMLAESIPDATLLEWRHRPGESVARDEILIELETDKVVLEVPAPADGVLAEVVKQPGETALSDEVIARIDTEASAPPAHREAPAGAEPSPAPEPPPSPLAEPILSPAARKLAEEHALDPHAIAGSGRGGRITKGDVLVAIAAGAQPAAGQPPPEPRPGEPAPAASAGPAASVLGHPDRAERREPITRLRARIAERLVEAQRTAAILTTFNEVDMAPVMALRRRYRERFEERHGARLGFMSFFVKAAVAALERFPAVNAYLEDDVIVYHDYCDIGVAVGSPRGLVVPVVRDAERLGFAAIERQIAELGQRARDARLSIEEMSGGTFTISNGGVFGSLLSTPILNPPQSAILGMHKTQERAVVVDGQIAVRPMMYLALSYDHRIVDGREAVQFLVTIKEAIEDPARLLLEV